MSSSFCITHQGHSGPGAKAIPWMGLRVPEAGLTQTVFPNVFFVCTVGTLCPSTVCGSFDWAGPAQLVDLLLLTNQVDFTK